MNFGEWDLGQWIVIGLCIFLLAWYVVAAYLNRKRGILIYRWIRDGLEKIGKLSEVSWIGSSGSGAQIAVKRATAPFQKIEVVFLLESRELLPLWLFNLLRNKRDEMILKAWLRNSPPLELEVARKRDRSFAKLLAHDPKRPFQLVSGLEQFQIAYRGKANPESLEKLEAFMAREGATVQRISLGRKAPHLAVRVFISPLMSSPSEEFFSSLQAWLQSISLVKA
ncbi:MAG: hypothetical protein AB1345_06345 [Chloroflexota bacterium]